MGSTVILVCARGGSKGVPFKNKQSPYEGYTPYEVLGKKIKGSRLSEYKKYVCSDSDEILDLADNAGFDRIKRPESLGTDKSRLVSVISFCKHELGLTDSDRIIQISPVAPFISIDTLNSFSTACKVHSVAISVTRFEGNCHPSLAGRTENNTFSFNDSLELRYPRQSRPMLHYPNGCIFARRGAACQGNLETNDFEKEMESIEMGYLESINIDTMEDWRLAKSVSSYIGNCDSVV